MKSQILCDSKHKATAIKPPSDLGKTKNPKNEKLTVLIVFLIVSGFSLLDLLMVGNEPSMEAKPHGAT